MDLLPIVSKLSAAGVTLHARGGRLAVESHHPLTDTQRAWIKTHKADLLRALTRLSDPAPAAPPPVPPGLTEEAHAALREAVEERAAVREFDGGEPRAAAERAARAAARVYHYRLTDHPGAWLTLICPGCDLEEARAVLSLKFGERVLEVAEHELWRADP